MPTDHGMVLALLTLRHLGGKSVPATAPLLKGFKDLLDDAKVQQLVIEQEEPVLSKSGKPGKRKVKVLQLTPVGERVLDEIADPTWRSAVMAGFLGTCKAELDADRAKLAADVRGALTTKGKPKQGQDLGGLVKAVDDLGKKVDALGKAVQNLAARLEKVDPSTAAGTGDELEARLGRAFADLFARLDQAMGRFAAPIRDEKPAPPSPVKVPPSPPEPTREDLGASLRKAYDHLCLFVEHQDGLVDLPRLFHETHKSRPELTLPAFHREIDNLWQRHAVELHILNEVQQAKEPDKGIWRDDRFYYFLYWPNP